MAPPVLRPGHYRLDVRPARRQQGGEHIRCDKRHVAGDGQQPRRLGGFQSRVQPRQRPGVPAVSIIGEFRTGDAITVSENPAAADIAFAALDKGTKKRSADDIQDDLKRTGSSFGISLGADSSRMSVSTLTSNLSDLPANG